jgi:hypothetical protein
MSDRPASRDELEEILRKDPLGTAAIAAQIAQAREERLLAMLSPVGRGLVEDAKGRVREFQQNLQRAATALNFDEAVYYAQAVRATAVSAAISNFVLRDVMAKLAARDCTSFAIEAEALERVRGR